MECQLPMKRGRMDALECVDEMLQIDGEDSESLAADIAGRYCCLHGANRIFRVANLDFTTEVLI